MSRLTELLQVYHQNGWILSSAISPYKYERIALATGFTSDISRFDWVQRAAQAEQMPCADCGFPIVGKDLQWGEGLYVMGAFAELEIGPTARNISGARKAAYTIAHTAKYTS